ncbi:lipopolysaccharide biosynthesis protein [Neobacillus sp. LXY-4]|uniref:lipopolysaccharide biosynthesis protein n=1 Tax=Neobacillus sp. LXY-4 TaxID=3379826 RepID=UPI003EE24C38
MKSTRNSIFGGIVWRFLERIGAQGVSLIVSIILARLLSPNDYGMVALVTVFTNFAMIFVVYGFGSALIQKKDSDVVDFSTIFYFNIATGIILYFILFFTAPYIEAFYNVDGLSLIVRIMALSVIISSINNVQQSYVSKTMQYRLFFYSTLVGTLVSAIVGIYMAYEGLGVWALVTQNLLTQLIGVVVLWFTVKWRPKLVFSFKRLKELYHYGWKIMVVGLFDTVYNELTSLIIGKLYTSEDLAFFNKGQQFPKLIVTNINSSIDLVLFSAMSEVQDEIDRVKRLTQRSIKTSTYIIAPIMMGLAVCADQIIELLLTRKWLSVVPFLQIFCIIYFFIPINTANLQAIKAIGRSDIFLKLGIIRIIVGITVLVFSMWYGVYAMALSAVITMIASVFINAYPNKKLIGYGYIEQVKDMLPSIILSFMMGAIINIINFIDMNTILLLILKIVVGIVFYICISWLFKVESFLYLLNIIKNYLPKRKLLK